MSWQGIEGNDANVEQFRRRIERGRLAGTYLFVGHEGIGKRRFAIHLAQALFCEGHVEGALAACERCPACRQVAAGSHPDLLLIEKPPDKNVLPIELFVGRREHRMQEGLCHDLGLKPFSASRRIAVIDDAQLLNEESANCLLKTLEEPPPGAVIVLISTAEDRMLSTIRSRCQTIRFRPLASAQIAAILVRDGSVSDAGEAQQIAAQSEGSMRVAQALAAPEMQQFHGALLAQLAEPAPDSQALVDLAVAFIEAGGRDAPLRRERARHVVGTALEFYRQVVRSRSGLAPLDGSELHPAVERSCREWRADDEAVVRCAQRCLEALEHIDSYAHQSAWLECWFDDLARFRGHRPSVST